jgi:hypothetical protein
MRCGGVAPGILERAEAGAGLFHRLQDIQQVTGAAPSSIPIPCARRSRARACSPNLPNSSANSPAPA